MTDHTTGRTRTTDHWPAVPELTEQQREQLLRSIATAASILHQVAEAVLPSVHAAARDLAKVVEALRQAGYIEEDGKPVQRADRPAWASPYGPYRRPGGRS